MSNVFFIGDTHFGHKNITEKFLKPDGSKLRPYDNVDEMNEALIENWNKVVKQDDKVIHLGDVVMNKRYLPLCLRLNGNKRLVSGNHDSPIPTEEMLKYFKNVYGSYQIDGMICSHLPLMEEIFRERWSVNIIGHLHARDILNGSYFNVSAEQINFTPISLEDLKLKIKEKQLRYPQNPKYSIKTNYDIS